MSVSGTQLLLLARQAGAALHARGWTLACAESCTAGGVAFAVTQVPGSSAWFDRALVVYSNAAKEELLGVPSALLEQAGAVSEPVARAMALGALERSSADVALSVTGIAGPDGGSAAKPVGTVCFAWAVRAVPAAALESRTFRFDGDRAAVRTQAIAEALDGLCRAVSAARAPD
jgi:nicotinamide-nucleotide amidase